MTTSTCDAGQGLEWLREERREKGEEGEELCPKESYSQINILLYIPAMEDYINSLIENPSSIS